MKHINQAREEGHLVLRGDATDDDILEEAGITRARGLVTALTGDSGNVLVTITARTMNPELYIVARGNEQDSIKILNRRRLPTGWYCRLKSVEDVWPRK